MFFFSNFQIINIMIILKVHLGAHLTRSDELGKAMEDCRQDGIPCTGCRPRFKIKRKLSFDDIFKKKFPFTILKSTEKKILW